MTLADAVRAYLGHRYTTLFYALLAALVAAPALTSLHLAGAVFEVLLMATLLAAVVPVESVRGRRILLGVMLVVAIARPATAWTEHVALSVMAVGTWTVLGLFAAGSALRFSLTAVEVRAEQLYAALSAYLLAGMHFGVLYWVLEQLVPGTFAAADGLNRVAAMYFSFVTLATLGYGDIVPRTDAARGLAIVEGIGGQLFLAVMVARLVGLYARR